jgi:hypothetical protein
MHIHDARHAIGVAAAAVKDQHERRRAAHVMAKRDVEEILAFNAADCERPLRNIGASRARLRPSIRT